MKYAIEILEKKLKDLNKPSEENEDDIYSAVLGMRQELELKIAIKVLKNALELNKDIKQITWD